MGAVHSELLQKSWFVALCPVINQGKLGKAGIKPYVAISKKGYDSSESSGFEKGSENNWWCHSYVFPNSKMVTATTSALNPCPFLEPRGLLCSTTLKAHKAAKFVDLWEALCNMRWALTLAVAQALAPVTAAPCTLALEWSQDMSRKTSVSIDKIRSIPFITLFITVEYIVYYMFNTEQWLRKWTVTVSTDSDSLAWLTLIGKNYYNLILFYYHFVCVYYHLIY